MKRTNLGHLRLTLDTNWSEITGEWNYCVIIAMQLLMCYLNFRE